MANLIGAYAAGINRVLTDKLKFDSDAPYVVHAPLWAKWAWKDFANKYVNVGESLRRAMHANPHMRVYVASGYYDLGTPHAAGDYTVSHLGLRGSMLHDTGAFLPWGNIVPYIAATTFPGPYVVPAYKIETTVVLTNRVPTTVVRGAGRPQAVFAMERLMDRVARELKLDRAELRRRNMIAPEQMPPEVSRNTGLAAMAGALADDEDLTAVIEQIYTDRRRARDRVVPDLG